MFGRRIRIRASKIAKRKRQKVVWWSVGSALFLLLVVAGLSYGTHRSEITIRETHIAGNKVVRTDELQGLIERELSGKYLWLFPKRNIFLFPKRGIEASVRSSYPRIFDAHITYDSPTSIRLEVKERKPFALWCGENYIPPGEGLGSCYFLDHTGYVFTKAPDFTGTVYLRFYGPLPGGNPIGERLLSEERFKALSEFVLNLRSFALESSALALVEEPDVELYLSSGARIIFDHTKELARVREDLASILHSESLGSDTLEEIDYIDLRFGSRVYYRFKDSSPVDE